MWCGFSWFPGVLEGREELVRKTRRGAKRGFPLGVHLIVGMIINWRLLELKDLSV